MSKRCGAFLRRNISIFGFSFHLFLVLLFLLLKTPVSNADRSPDDSKSLLLLNFLLRPLPLASFLSTSLFNSLFYFVPLPACWNAWFMTQKSVWEEHKHCSTTKKAMAGLPLSPPFIIASPHRERSPLTALGRETKADFNLYPLAWACSLSRPREGPYAVVPVALPTKYCRNWRGEDQTHYRRQPAKSINAGMYL